MAADDWPRSRHLRSIRKRARLPFGEIGGTRDAMPAKRTRLQRLLAALPQAADDDVPPADPWHAILFENVA
jgi:hypothetical protein